MDVRKSLWSDMRASPHLLRLLTPLLAATLLLQATVAPAAAQTADQSERERLAAACYEQMAERVDVSDEYPDGRPRLDLPACDTFRAFLVENGDVNAAEILDTTIETRRMGLSTGFSSDYTAEEVRESTHLRSDYSEQTRENQRLGVVYIAQEIDGSAYNAQQDRSIRERGGDCRYDSSRDVAVCLLPSATQSSAASGTAQVLSAPRNPTVAECAAEMSPDAYRAVQLGAEVEARSLADRIQESGGATARGAATGAAVGVAAKTSVALLALAGVSAPIPVVGWGVAAVAGVGALIGAGIAWLSSDGRDRREANRLLEEPEVAEQVEEYAVCLLFASLDVTRDNLPSWRWRQAGDLISEDRSVVSDVFSGATYTGFFASLLFTTASTFWSWLIDLLREGTSLDVLSGRAQQVNEFFLLVTDGIRDSGLPLIALIFTLLAAVMLLLRGKGAGAFRTLFIAAVPLAVLLGLAGASRIVYLTEEEYPGASNYSIPVNVDFATGVPQGSPGWLGLRGAALTQNISTGLLSGFGAISPGSNTLDSVLGDANTACNAYVRTLYEQVDGTSLNRLLAGGSNTKTMAYAGSSDIMAMLWQSGFLNPWMVAQYGSLDQGGHMYCFDLERRSGVPAPEQRALLTLAFDNGVEYHNEVFSPFGDQKDVQARMFAWAACAPDRSGGMNPNPEWQKITSVDRDLCEGWFLRGETALLENLKFENADQLRAAASAAAGAGDPGLAYQTVLAYWGDRGAQRLSQGILAAAVSGIYLYSVGGIAAGSIIAQYGLFILLALLPATLVLIAFPGPDGRRNQGGMRLLKLTGAMFFAKLMLDLVLATLMQLINLLTGLSGSLSLSSGISGALVPLAALLILRKILQTVGLGNITSLTGAAALTTNIAALATRDQALARSVSGSFGQQGNELRRLGRFARRMNPVTAWNRRIQRAYYRAQRSSTKRKKRQDRYENRTLPNIERRRGRRALNRGMQAAADRSEQLGSGTEAALGELAEPVEDFLEAGDIATRSDVHGRAIGQVVANETAQRALSDPSASPEDLSRFADARQKELSDAAEQLDTLMLAKLSERESLADRIKDMESQIASTSSVGPLRGKLEAALEDMRTEFEEVNASMSQTMESFADGLSEALKDSLSGFSRAFADAEATYRSDFGRRLRKGPELSPNIPPPLP